MNCGRLITRDYVRGEKRSTVRLTHILGSELARHLGEGATLVVDSVDRCHAPLGDLVQRLEHELYCWVHANVYAGWKETPGLDLHWDRHDVMILQVEGKKHWQVYGETRKHPIAGDIENCLPPDCSPLWESDLNPGDVLYIPRGWWHIATPCGEPTLHITLGLTSPTGIDLVMWLAGELKNSENMRRDLPLDQGGECAVQHKSQLLSIISEAFKADSLMEDCFLGLTAHTPPRGYISFPLDGTGRLLPPSEDFIIHTATPRLRPLLRDDGPIEIIHNAKSLRFASEAKSLLDYLDCFCPVSVRDFRYAFKDTFNEEAIDEVLQGLASNGVIFFRPPKIDPLK